MKTNSRECQIFHLPITDYEQARESIIKKVNDSLTNSDKEFLVSFEDGIPLWEKCCAGDLSQYPSVQWKLLNIDKLKKQAPDKYKEGVDKLKRHLWI